MNNARVVELVYTTDLKSVAQKASRFESGREHHWVLSLIG